MLASTRGHWQAIVANVLWGTTFLATHEVVTAWGPIASSALRFSIAAIALLIGMKLASYPLQTPRKAKQWGWVALTAVFGFGLLYPLQAKGLTLISTGMSAIIMLTAPLFLVGLSATFGAQVSREKWLGVLIGMLGGVVLICNRQQLGNSAPLAAKGAALTIAASLCLAASSLTAKRAMLGINQGSITFWSMLIGAMLIAPFALTEQQPTVAASNGAWSCLLYLALVCSVLAFFLWNQALSVGDPLTIASSMHIKTPIAVALGCIINGEGLNWIIIGGGLLVGVGVWVAQKQSLSKIGSDLKRVA